MSTPTPEKPEEFGKRALATRDAFVLSTEDRIKLGLEDPDAKGALSIRVTDKLTNARIRYAMSELLNMNLDNAHNWLQQVAAQSPKAALELLLELAQFTTPKLKALAVQVDDRSNNPKSMSVAELERLVSEQ